MLATKADAPPVGDGWIHEVKWDGVRVIADVSEPPGARSGSDRHVRLTSRNDNAVTIAWPDVVAAATGRDLVVDGEVIALNERGLPDFRVIQERMHVRRASTAAALADRVPAVFMVFDLLRLDGAWQLDRPLEERRSSLEALVAAGDVAGVWQAPAGYEDGAMLWAATEQQGLEGVVSKRLSSPYRPGERSPYWLKRAHRHRHSYVVGGWRPQEGTRDRLGALLIGEPTAAGLAYRGRVGSGIGGRQAAALAQHLAPLTRPDSPFADAVPAVDARGTTWVEPVLVVDVDTHGTARDQRVRQPSYQGVRDDLAPADLPRQPGADQGGSR